MGVIIKKYGLQVEREGQDPIKIHGNRNSRTQQLSDLTKTATADQRAMIEELRKQYSNYKNDLRYGMNNVAAARYQDDFNQKVVDILNGKITDPSQLYSSTNLTSVKENRSGSYSRAAIDAMGDTASREYGKDDQTAASTTGSTTAGATTGTTTTAQPAATTTVAGSYNFDPLLGVSNGYLNTMTDNEKRKRLLSGVATNLQGAIDAITAGKNVWYGSNVPNKNLSKDQLAIWKGIVDSYVNTNWDDLPTARTAASKISPIFESLGIDPSIFSNYFTFNQTSDEEALARLKNEGWDTEIPYNDAVFDTATQKYLHDNNVRLFRNKDGRMRAYSSNWNPYGNLWHINSDYGTKNDPAAKYGFGLYSDAQGNVYYGDMQPGTNFSVENPFFNGVMDRLKAEQDRNDTGYYTMSQQYNPIFQTGGSDLLAAVYDQYYGNPDAAPAVQALDVPGMVNMLDASPYFSGDMPILAMNTKNAKFTKDILGRPVFDDNTVFYYRDNEGRVKTANMKDYSALGSYNINGWRENADQLGFNKGITDLRIKGVSYNPIIEQSKHIRDLGGKDALVYKYMKWITSPQSVDAETAKLLQRLTPTDQDQRDLILYIQHLVNSGQVKIDNAHRADFQNLYKTYASLTEQPQSQKNGGVVTAKEGTMLDWNKQEISNTKTPAEKQWEEAEAYRNDIKAKAKEKGYSDPVKYQQNQVNWHNRTSQQNMQIAALVLDLLSLGASFFKGAGSAVSLATGLSSTVLNTITDIQSDGLDWGDIKNLALNVGMDFGALINGTTHIGKIAASAAKLAPLILSGFEQLQNGKVYADIYNKFVKREPLSVDEMKTLVAGVSLLAGTSRAITSGVRVGKAKRAVENNYSDSDKIVNVKSTDASGKQEVKKISVKDAEKIAQAKDYNEANSLFQAAVGDEKVNIIPDKNSRLGHGWKGFVKPENSTSNPLSEYKAIVDESNMAAKYNALGEYAKYKGNYRTPIATDADRAVGNTRMFGVLRGEYNPYKLGGKLERLQAYINSK